MDYYRCSIEALRLELERRQFATYGSHDLLSEQLRADDDAKGSEATTVTTESPSVYAPREINLMRTVEFGKTVPATQLMNQSLCNGDAQRRSQRLTASQRSYTGP